MLRVLRRKEVLAACLMIFAADVVSGIVSPGFSLYATGLGASLTLIGALGSIEGLTRILASVPIGLLSDAHGRKNILSAGMLLFAISSYLFTVVQVPVLFLPVRVMVGLAMVSTFFVGVAYIGDVVVPEERGAAVGLYATFMGTGFAVGSALGGQVTAVAGYQAACLLASGVAMAGFVVARLGLAGQRGGFQNRPAPGVLALAAQWALLRDPHLLAASVANLANNAWYSTMISFFPVYAASLAVGEGALGNMFAVRALLSSGARLPTGLLTMRIPSRSLLIASLGVALLVFATMAGVTLPWLLGVLLAIEGVAYGIFLTSGQAYVSEHSTEACRGGAVGVYSTAGGIGSTAAPLLLGPIADVWGIRTVFWLTATMMGVSMLAAWAIGMTQVRPATQSNGGLPEQL